MRRHSRPLVLIAALLVLSGLILGFQNIHIAGFERGGDAPLGLKLGLDLRGGVHLVYQARLEDPNTGEPISPTKDQMNALKRTIERRVNKSGLGEPNILLLGEDRLLVQLPGVRDVARAKAFVGETARLEFKHRSFNIRQGVSGLSAGAILGVRIGLAPAATLTPESATSTAPELAPGTEPAGPGQQGPALFLMLDEGAAAELDKVVERLQRSLDPVPGTGEVYPSFLEVTVSGDQTRTFSVSYYPVLSFQTGESFVLPGEPLVERVEGTPEFFVSLLPIATSTDGALEILGESPTVSLAEVMGKRDDDIGLTGEDLARAYPGQHQTSGAPIVNIEFNSRGTRIFGEQTAKIAGTPDQIAIFLDDEELIAPTVQTAITGGAAYIQGRDFTVERVRDLALLLEAGRLPVPIGDPILERDVGPSLGAASLRKSAAAGAIGVVLVLLFVALYYRVPGLVAAAALMTYVALLLAVFKILPVTLTLSGLAAAILSVGMAVDANILIFERMKEELRLGRTLLSSINIGFNRAWPAIRDSNLSTLITSAILFWFADQLGATIVQGFAITLATGVALSMFTAITVSRTFLRVVAEVGLGKRLALFVPAGRADLPLEQALAVQRS